MFALLRANPWLGLAAELTLLVAYIGLLRLLQRRLDLSPETARKLFHIGGGLSTLTFPWLFAALWPPLVMAPITIGALLALKHLRGLRAGLGNVLYGIERRSLGEVYMPLSITLVWLLARGNPVLYTVPVLVLALADPCAALIGTRFGRVRYRLVSGQKTLEGSLAFALVACAGVQVPLLLFTRAGYGTTFLIALNVALLAMLAEAVAWHGLDNLFIPLLTFGVLQACLGLHMPALAAQLTLVAMLGVVVLGWGVRSARSSDQSARSVPLPLIAPAASPDSTRSAARFRRGDAALRKYARPAPGLLAGEPATLRSRGPRDAALTKPAPAQYRSDTDTAGACVQGDVGGAARTPAEDRLRIARGEVVAGESACGGVR